MPTSGSHTYRTSLVPRRVVAPEPADHLVRAAQGAQGFGRRRDKVELAVEKVVADDDGHLLSDAITLPIEEALGTGPDHEAVEGCVEAGMALESGASLPVT
jgi:hypothetical protein